MDGNTSGDGTFKYGLELGLGHSFSERVARDS